MTSPNRGKAVEALDYDAKRRSERARQKIEKTLKEMVKSGSRINVHAVHKKSEVSRNTIYRHPDLLERIRAHSARGADSPAARLAPEREEGTVAAALRRRMTAKEHDHKNELSKRDREIKDLRQEVAALHGEIRRLKQAGAP